MSTIAAPHVDDSRAGARVRAHRRAGLRSVWAYYAAVVVIIGAAVFAALCSRGWIPGVFAPDKLVVRGCQLTDAAEIVAAMECDGTQAVPELWMRARGVKKSHQRWLESISVGSDWGRSAVLNVAERRPLIQVKGGGFPYWLCDDGTLVAKQENDRQGVFAQIASLPVMSLPEDPGAGKLAAAMAYLQLVAACDKYLPGQISRLELDHDGALFLYQPSGFEIRLGQCDSMVERIAALPQVLRVCEAHKERLRYLYATEVNGTLVFYEKWKGKAGAG